MKKLYFIILAMLLTSCARFDIRRINKNQRIIRVETLMNSKEQLVMWTMYKAVMLECANTKIIEVIEGSHATAICTDEGHMFDRTTVREVPVQ